MGKNKNLMLNSKKVFKLFKNILYGVLIALSVMLAYHGIRVRVDMDFIPSVFGHTYLNVLSGSMEPEYNVHDVVVGKKIKDSSNLKVGDVVTYKEDMRLVTHRIVEVGEGNTFKTKGDANADTDETNLNGENIVSVVKFKIPKGGYVVAKFQDFTFLALAWIIVLYGIISELIKELKKKKKSARSEV